MKRKKNDWETAWMDDYLDEAGTGPLQQTSRWWTDPWAWILIVLAILLTAGIAGGVFALARWCSTRW